MDIMTDVVMVIYRLFCCAKRVGGHGNNGAAAVAVDAVGSVTPNWFMNKLLLLKQMRNNLMNSCCC